MEPKLTPTYADKMNGNTVEHEPIPWPGYGPQPYTLSSIQPAEVIPIVQPAPQPRKIAIIGTAPSSRDLAPYGDLSWEIWACSPGNQNVIPRVNRWYEIHANLMDPDKKHYGAPYIEWLKQKSQEGVFPDGLWMQDHEDWVQAERYGIPGVKAFPWQHLVREFGPYFFTSTFAWCMAQAISEGVQEIALYGVDMASRDEYILQRPGGHFFLWECKKRGIKVSIPYESDLEQPPALYAISETTPQLRKWLARQAELKGRVAAMEQELNKAAAIKEQMTYLKGALENLDYDISIWGGGGHGRELREIAPREIIQAPVHVQQRVVEPSE